MLELLLGLKGRALDPLPSKIVNERREDEKTAEKKYMNLVYNVPPLFFSLLFLFSSFSLLFFLFGLDRRKPVQPSYNIMVRSVDVVSACRAGVMTCHGAKTS